MPEISQAGLELIRNFEGFSPMPYVCPAGKPTIGYGHVIHSGDSLSAEGITREVAEELLRDDVIWAENAVRQYIAVELSQSQFDALVSFVYNVGATAFARSTMRRLLNQGRFDEAAAQFTRWSFVHGKRLEGLFRRRQAEKALFEKKGNI